MRRRVDEIQWGNIAVGKRAERLLYPAANLGIAAVDQNPQRGIGTGWTCISRHLADSSDLALRRESPRSSPKSGC